MKKHPITAIASLGLAAAAFTLTACTNNEDYGGTVEKAAEDTAESAERTMENAADATSDAMDRAGDALASTWNDIQDATYDERASFRSGLEQMSSRIDNQIDQWSDRASALPEQSREAWNNSLEELKEARADLNNELEELGDATEDNWEEAKQEAGEAWNRVQNAYDDLKNRAKS